MGSLYSGTSVSGYNSNPPPDDGSTGSNNQITWGSTIKAKLADPLNTAIASMSTALVTAFSKSISGGTVVKTGVSYAMGPSDQGRCIVATASGITITTPDATSVLNPFLFFFSNQSTGTITLAGNSNGSQTVDGNTSTTIYPGCGGIIQTDGSNWFTNGLVQGNIRTVNPAFGFDMPVNFEISASATSNLLSVSVLANNGNNPSTSNPVLVPFQTVFSGTITTGAVTWVSITSALSMNTNATGATLGTANSVPFRIWYALFNNAGTAVLAMMQTVTGGSSPTAIAPIAEYGVASTTGISAAATSAGVWYTPNGTTLTNCAFRLIGYSEYASGLTTAGTYASNPTRSVLYGPGVKKPGDIVQTVFSSTTSQQTANSATKVATSLTATITPTSAINLVKAAAFGSVACSSSQANTEGICTAQIWRGTGSTAIGNQGISVYPSASAISASGASTACFALDSPQSASSTQYGVYIAVPSGTLTWSFPGTASAGSSMILEEIMT